MSKLEIKGLDEFEKKLKMVQKKAPDRIITKLDDEGKKLRKSMRANTPKGATGKLKRGYKLEKVKKVGSGYEKGLYNKAPHHHLVNNGHRKVTPGGRHVGFVDGLFYVEKTVAQQESSIATSLDGWLEEMFQELK